MNTKTWIIVGIAVAIPSLALFTVVVRDSSSSERGAPSHHGAHRHDGHRGFGRGHHKRGGGHFAHRGGGRFGMGMRHHKGHHGGEGRGRGRGFHGRSGGGFGHHGGYGNKMGFGGRGFGMRRGGGRGILHLVEKLELSKEQKTKIDGLHKAFKAKVAPLREKMKSLDKAREGEKGVPDKKVALKRFEERAGAKKALFSARVEFFEAVKGALTKEQQAKFDELWAKRPRMGRGPRGRGMRRGGGFGHRHHGRGHRGGGFGRGRRGRGGHGGGFGHHGDQGDHHSH